MYLTWCQVMDLRPAILAAALLITMVSSPYQVSALSYLSQSFSKARNPAQPCDESQCKLPDCRCAGTDIPGGLPVSDTPQIVMISFDDGVRVIDYESYYSPVFSGRKNPNGCPIVLTLFASHNYTDYALVEELYYTHGYEMADHSVTHREPVDWWSSATYEEWTHEIMDEKAILNKFCMIINLPTRHQWALIQRTGHSRSTINLQYVTPLPLVPRSPTLVCGLYQTCSTNRRMDSPVPCWMLARTLRPNKTGLTSLGTTSMLTTMVIAHRLASTPTQHGSFRVLNAPVLTAPFLMSWLP